MGNFSGMRNKHKFIAMIVSAVVLGLVALLIWQSSNIAILNPKGAIASQQRDLIVAATLLMLIVVVPVFILTFAIAWKYRATNTKARYSPNWDHSRKLETLWWAVPCAIIAVLAVITWQSSHALDPYKPLDMAAKPITIEVVALPWKWLFIYPEQDIATVNFVRFPEDRPVNFRITADAPMNSFWIPQLGGQVYAMAGMETKLHLVADEPGVYRGGSANLSGEGFADMDFEAKATTQAEFDEWVALVKKSPHPLDAARYQSLAAPSKNHPIMSYSTRDADLYDKVIMKYMTPGMQHPHVHNKETH